MTNQNHYYMSMDTQREMRPITTDEFYEFITKHMTPEEALKKLLTISNRHYQVMKEDALAPEKGNPLLIMSRAAMDLNWLISTEKGSPDSEVRGLSLGTEEYLKSIFNGNTNEV